MQKFIMNAALYVALVIGGAALDRFVLNKPDKTTTTEVAKTTDTSSKTTTDINQNKSSEETQKNHVEIKRKIQHPDGTIVSEDIVGDFWLQKKEQENLVMRQENETLVKENLRLKQVVEENTLPKVLVTLLPTYNFSDPLKLESITYSLMIQTRVISTCYIGVMANKDMVGVPLTCGF